MKYERKYFNPAARAGSQTDPLGNVIITGFGPQQEELYVFAPKVILAVNVALATGRPLLVSGEPGCGKSSLARAVSAVLGARHYQRTVTSRTLATDLLWTFDALGRLNAASLREALPPAQHHVEPGPLWWALNPVFAEQRGIAALPGLAAAKDPGTGPLAASTAVLLVDELDKADSDVPNDLLEPFDRKVFTVRETGDEIEAKRTVQLILTTNRERTMPRAFLRRCITIELEAPTVPWLVSIAVSRYGASKRARYAEIAEQVIALRVEAKRRSVREPSTAEYLDAVIASDSLNPELSDQAWEEIKRALLWKTDTAFPQLGSASA